jgi:hypothetical protein
LLPSDVRDAAETLRAVKLRVIERTRLDFTLRPDLLSLSTRRILHWNVTEHPRPSGRRQLRRFSTGEEP